MRYTSIIAVVLVLGGLVPARADRVIDDFNYGNGRISFPLTSSTAPALHESLVLSDSHILGGSRVLDFLATQKPSHRSAILGVSYGVLSLDTGSGVVTETTVRWGGGGSLLADLTNGGLDDRFLVDLVDTDLNLTLALRVIDLQGGKSTLTQTTSTSGDLRYYFHDFRGTANFSQVSAIEMWFTGPAAIDMRLDFFGTQGDPLLEPGNTVPEPSWIVLGASGMGLAGAFRFFRRRRAA